MQPGNGLPACLPAYRDKIQNAKKPLASLTGAAKAQWRCQIRTDSRQVLIFMPQNKQLVTKSLLTGFVDFALECACMPHQLAVACRAFCIN